MNTEIIYKQVVAFSILAALFFQTFNKTFIIADYYSNTGKYARNCENKDKLQMQCNGKCQMMKKLNAEDKKDQENPGRKSENKNEITLSFNSFFPSVALNIAVADFQKLLPTPGDNSIDRSFDIFHPPQL